MALDVEKLLVKRGDNFLKAMLTSWKDRIVNGLHIGAEFNLFHIMAIRVGYDKLWHSFYRKPQSETTIGFGFGPEWARVNIVRRGVLLLSSPAKWVFDFAVNY